MNQGWKPFIEDTTQELVDDEYPKIPNPVTYQEYISVIAPAYLSEIVRTAGRQQVIDNFQSIYETVVANVRSGSFDDLILSGDVETIRQQVRDSL